MHTFLKHSFKARLAGGACALALLLAACGYGGSGGYNGGATPAPTVTLTVAPTSIVLGQSATLTWVSTNASSCIASGAWSGSQATDGTSVQTPTAVGALTFTLTCTAASGGSAAKSANLTVTAPTAFTVTSLVADTAGTAALNTDAHLVNPWGIAFGATTAIWVANNHSATATQYDGNGKAQPTAAPLIVNFAPGAAGAFNPTGMVANASTDFVVTATASGAARFIFAGEGGMIAGWSPGVDRTHAITSFTAVDGAVYKGLAIANNGAGNFLYAADFHGNKVDVFDTHFSKQAASATAFAFVDPTLPAGYAPFGIQALKTGAAGATQIFVTYAQQNGTDNHDQTNGAGLGLVNIFDTNGVFVSHFVASGGLLNAPWGVALAPADFGTLSNAVLIGNFGDGKVNAFNTDAGAVVGAVVDAHGAAFAQPGLRAIAFGNDTGNQPHNTLFFSAGVNDQVNGEFGRIDAGGAPVLNAAPVVTLTAPTGTVSGTVNISATVQGDVAIAKVEFFAGGIALGSATTAPFTTVWDTTTIADGTVAINAKATDVDGNVGVAAADVVVSNTPAPVTLSQLQTAVFTPKCSGCHNGSNPPGGALPGSQNLTAGNSFAALVGVASLEQPALRRVKTGDPDNSYLIQKLEGLAGITGSRMPLGGPFLDQATIDQIKSWISSGAPNN